MNGKALYLEEVEAGTTFDLPEVEMTQELRDKHVKLYGEDWADDENLGSIKKLGVMPSTAIVSVVAGQMGAAEILKIHRMKKYEVDCHDEIRVGDSIRTTVEVKERLFHHNPQRPYGYVTAVQRVFRKREGQSALALTRTLTWTVYTKDIERVVAEPTDKTSAPYSL